MEFTSKDLVELVLFGPTGDRRQLQDSPVLGDVWLAYAAKPTSALDLLITPEWSHPAGPVAKRIAEQLSQLPKNAGRKPANVAYLHGLIAAKLTFRDLVRVIVPMTAWWQERKIADSIESYQADGPVTGLIEKILNWTKAWVSPNEETREDEKEKCMIEFAKHSSLDRFVALIGIILWAGEQQLEGPEAPMGANRILTLESPDEIVDVIKSLFKEIQNHPTARPNHVYQVSLNRKAMPALSRSVAAVKGDAARNVFKVSCESIGWAIFDSGIEGSHQAFDKLALDGSKCGSRIVGAYDFSKIREVVSLDNLDLKEEEREKRIKTLCENKKYKFGRGEAARGLKKLADDADNDRPIDWSVVEKFIEISINQPPKGGHGTHVAGIIGGHGTLGGGGSDGMCPDIQLYDFRVLSTTLEDTEFAIIAALQFVRYLNSRQGFMRIHGANLSLSIPHDVRNFACGRTPICEECERVVDSGVVVVAAAGNLGYQSFETKNGSYDGYTAFSITDPGNAESVITVGATHRYWPHTYGVSFFSSRGPTGDGRIKPDLVAPGERIVSCLIGGTWGEMDGTSMAAPHVSGAAAMLMARYSEMIGQPRKIKRILCESATDLGRERTFQGHGMLDVLRAFQKI